MMSSLSSFLSTRRRFAVGRQLGFTIVEIVVLIVIIVILFTLGTISYRAGTTVTGLWTTSPGTLTQAPDNHTFIFGVTRTTIVIQTTTNPEIGRLVTFNTAPNRHIKIMTINGTPVNASSGSGTTDLQGEIEVVIQVDHIGAGILVAKDGPSGQTEMAVFTGVP